VATKYRPRNVAAQRPAELAPAIRARAGALPLRDASADAAMAILTVHAPALRRSWVTSVPYFVVT
jgi:hypothetical protein